MTIAREDVEEPVARGTAESCVARVDREEKLWNRFELAANSTKGDLDNVRGALAVDVVVLGVPACGCVELCRACLEEIEAPKYLAAMAEGVLGGLEPVHVPHDTALIPVKEILKDPGC